MQKLTAIIMTLKYILENASEEAPVKFEDIKKHLEEQGVSVTRNTMSAYIKAIKEAGYNIITVKTGKYNAFYISYDMFDDVEARMLCDSVISANFISPNRTNELINKICRLTSDNFRKKHMNRLITANVQKHNNSSTYYSIDAIQRAIESEYMIAFSYFKLDENKNRVDWNNGKRYEVYPITLLNNNNRYYLVAYEPDVMKNREKTFRIDRMYKTEIIEKFLYEIPINVEECINKYRSSVFKMFSGDWVMVLFEFDFLGMNMIYDKYGEGIIVSKLDDNRYRSRLKVEISPPFWGWLVQLGRHISIIEPYDLNEKFRLRIREILDRNEGITTS